MKCEVISAYTDKNDGLTHLVGESVELAEARANELASAGFVEKPKAAAKRPAARKAAPKAKKAE